MTSFSARQLRNLVQDRKRPVAALLGCISNESVSTLVDYWQAHKSENILGDSIKLREQRDLPLGHVEMLQNSYSQVAIQQLRDEGCPDNPQDYTSPVLPKIVQAIETILGPTYRMRISALEAGSSIPEHIDNPGQIRVLVLLDGNQEFIIKANTKEQLIEMNIGELWFVNTAWPHSVRNAAQKTRLTLLIDLMQLPVTLQSGGH